jgi:F-type H+-transporting ATPase subunit delta|tara:strand:- start:219 stop:776 length:558 start_codon:yes stop_codon:yes gene_type:complete
LSDKNRFSDSSAKSYSQALYELATEEKNLNDVEEHAVSIIKLISQSEDFNSLIKDPTNKQDDQLNSINIIFEKFNLNNLLKKFLNFLVVKRRFFYVEKILKDFVMICSKNRGEISAQLTVAKELNANEINKIKDELSQNFGSNVKLNYTYDPDLIGGLIMQVESVMIDTSIKNKLQKIENKMIEA